MTFINKGGPDTKAVPVEIIRKVQGRPILAIRDPADPFPATIPPAQQQLQEANKNLEYVLLPDVRGGKMDSAAHGFSGREKEVFRITLDWLKRHGFNRQPQPNKGMQRTRNTAAFLNSTARARRWCLALDAAPTVKYE